MTHLCEFCEVEHSSASCFHPGRARFVELQRTAETTLAHLNKAAFERDKLRARVALLESVLAETLLIVDPEDEATEEGLRVARAALNVDGGKDG